MLPEELVAEGNRMKPVVVILTCQRDRRMADLLVCGIERYWPEVKPVLMVDTDRSTEVSLPADVREVVRRVPYLRRVFDAPYLSDNGELYFLDSDCLICGHPSDFCVPAYQGVPGFQDDTKGVEIWRDLGVEFPVRPRLVGGMLSAPTAMWHDNLDLSIAYVRECVKRGYDKLELPGVICEQTLQAGLWKKTYPDNHLDYNRYPINHMTSEQVIVHLCSAKACNTHGGVLDVILDKYEASFL